MCECFYPILSIFSGSYYVHGYLTDFASESLFACLQQTVMDAGIYFSQTNSYFYLGNNSFIIFYDSSKCAREVLPDSLSLDVVDSS